MIYGVGCDIVDIKRIEKLYKKAELDFLDQILSNSEKKNYYLIDNSERKVAYLAKRFAAKEAFSKALGTGMGNVVSFCDISVLNDQNGKPYIILEKDILILKDRNIKIDVSISDEGTNALAFIIISIVN